MTKYRMIGWWIVLMAVSFFHILVMGAAAGKELTVESAYPGLAMGILKSAKLVKLDKEVLLTAEGTRIEDSALKEQNTLARDNPVDRARSPGRPTVVEFGATGCRPSDMMQPILANLKEKYKDRLNVLFVHVGEEQILGARYGISSIPVQVFFDETGQEVFRHTGFYPQNEIQKNLAAVGVR